jgi:glyoxylase-like metal-dependent hydrolase (beta-lactamase superfamily II)
MNDRIGEPSVGVPSSSNIAAGTEPAVHILDCGIGLGFLIETQAGLYLLDCGSPGREDVVLAKMRELGRSDLKAIWISHAHYDHYGSAARLRQLTGAKIGIHPADADALANGKSPLGTTRSYGFVYAMVQPLIKIIHPLQPVFPDFTLEDGESLQRFGLEALILHTPGHTPGSSTLLLADGTAFASDLLGSASRPHLQSLLATDWDQLPDSLKRLQAAHPKQVYAGHSHKVIHGDVFKAIIP